MFGLRIARSERESNTVPWFTVGWIVILAVLFGWSQWGLSSRTNTMNQAKEKMICFYLKHDYTIVPDNVKKFFPKVLRKHSHRVQPFIEFYHRGGMAHEQARQWLREGDWNRSNLGLSATQGASCLQQAIAKGQLRKHPKKRLFMTMASLVPRDIQRNQTKLERLGQLYLKSRQQHPWYGWGLVPADGDPVGFLSSIAIASAWFSLLWQVLLLWLIAGFLEQEWGGPIWIAVFWLGGLIGSFALFILQMDSETPILGSHNAIAAVMGMWTFATIQRPLLLSLPQKLTKTQLPTFPSWLIALIWLSLSLVDSTLQGYNLVPHAIVHLLCFGIGAVVLWGLQSMEWLETLPFPVPEKSAQPIKAPERTQPRAFKKASNQGGRKSLYLKPDLKQMVKKTYQQGQYHEAVTMYRELYMSGQARLEDFDELFIASEKGQIEPIPDDFLRAIRAAAYSRRSDKALGYYHRCDNKRDIMDWSEREQISLAQELKRAGLMAESLEEIESIMDEGPDGNFFMDALLLKIEIQLAQGDDLEGAFQLLYKAELYLEQKPQYKEAVEQMRLMMADADGGSVPEIRQIPTGLGPSAFGQQESDSPQDQEIDASLLDDLAAFEQRMMDEDSPAAAGQSWSELPSLLLRDKKAEDPEQANVRIADIDDEFLLGDSEEIPTSPTGTPLESPISSIDISVEAPVVGNPSAGLEEKGNPEAFFKSIEVNVDAGLDPGPLADTEKSAIPEMAPPSEVTAPSEVSVPSEVTAPSEKSVSNFETLADESEQLLNEVLQHQAELEQQKLNAAAAFNEPVQPPSDSRPWESSWDNLPQPEAPASPVIDPDLESYLHNAGFAYESLNKPGLETTAVPSIKGLQQGGAVDPSSLLESGEYASDEPDPAITNSNFDLPLFGGEESLSAADSSKTLLSDDLQNAAEMAKALAMEDISIGQDPLGMDSMGATEEELPALNHLESLKAGRPVLLLDDTPATPVPGTYGLTEHSKDDDNKG